MPFLTHDGVSLHYTDEGRGAPLLFLHGLGGNTENWTLQRRHFAAVRRVIALDLPGHGRSDGREVPFRRYWEAIEALADRLAVERLAICGLSKGGRAGLMFAARRPGRVSHIALVNGFVRLAPADRSARLALYDLLLEPGGPALWAERLLTAMGVAPDSAIARGFRRSLAHIDPLHIHRIFNELIAFDQRAELAAVGCAALLVRGARDAFVPAYCTPELHALLARSSVADLPAQGHLPYLEDPPAFNALLARFLASD